MGNRLDVCQLGLGLPISLLPPYQLQGDIYNCLSCGPLGTLPVRSSNSCQDRQPVIMDWIRSLFWLKDYYNFSLFVKHITGSINTLADSVSRLDDVKHWPTFRAWLSKSSGSHDFESHVVIVSCSP